MTAEHQARRVRKAMYNPSDRYYLAQMGGKIPFAASPSPTLRVPQSPLHPLLFERTIRPEASMQGKAYKGFLGENGEVSANLVKEPDPSPLDLLMGEHHAFAQEKAHAAVGLPKPQALSELGEHRIGRLFHVGEHATATLFHRPTTAQVESLSQMARAAGQRGGSFTWEMRPGKGAPVQGGDGIESLRRAVLEKALMEKRMLTTTRLYDLLERGALGEAIPSDLHAPIAKACQQMGILQPSWLKPLAKAHTVWVKAHRRQGKQVKAHWRQVEVSSLPHFRYAPGDKHLLVHLPPELAAQGEGLQARRIQAKAPEGYLPLSVKDRPLVEQFFREQVRHAPPQEAITPEQAQQAPEPYLPKAAPKAERAPRPQSDEELLVEFERHWQEEQPRLEALAMRWLGRSRALPKQALNNLEVSQRGVRAAKLVTENYGGMPLLPEEAAAQTLEGAQKDAAKAVQAVGKLTVAKKKAQDALKAAKAALQKTPEAKRAQSAVARVTAKLGEVNEKLSALRQERDRAQRAVKSAEHALEQAKGKGFTPEQEKQAETFRKRVAQVKELLIERDAAERDALRNDEDVRELVTRTGENALYDYKHFEPTGPNALHHYLVKIMQNERIQMYRERETEERRARRQGYQTLSLQGNSEDPSANALYMDKLESQATEFAPDVAQTVMRALDFQTVKRFLGEMPKAERRVLLLHAAEGHSLGAIAQATGEPLEQVKENLHSARAKVRRSRIMRAYLQHYLYGHYVSLVQEEQQLKEEQAAVKRATGSTQRIQRQGSPRALRDPALQETRDRLVASRREFVDASKKLSRLEQAYQKSQEARSAAPSTHDPAAKRLRARLDAAVEEARIARNAFRKETYTPAKETLSRTESKLRGMMAQRKVREKQAQKKGAAR